MEAIKERRSIRRFKSDPVPKEVLGRVLDVARWAPSAGNIQARDLIVVKDDEKKKSIAHAALNQMFIAEAPIVIVVCANQERSAYRYGDRGRYLYSIQDAAAATQNLLLAVHAEGLGACWVGAFNEEKVREILEIPKGVRPVTIVPIGYPAEKPTAPSRVSLHDFVHTGKY